MNKSQAELLVKKVMTVILSCENYTQLLVAVKYADFAYARLAKEIGLINNTNFITCIERSIGYAQCQIKQRDKDD